jgi:AcrR family transcriptional regulator
MSSKIGGETRRQRQARATRMEIVAAARRLFAHQGYAATTIAEVAREAGVSPQTIYDSVGSKAQLVRLLNDLIDEEAGVGELVAGMIGSTDPGVVLSLPVEITARIFERCGDIVRIAVAARPSEPTLAEVSREGQRRHAEGSMQVAGRLAGMGALRVPIDEAARSITALTDVVWWVMLHDDYGWTLDEIRAWVRDALARLIIG